MKAVPAPSNRHQTPSSSQISGKQTRALAASIVAQLLTGSGSLSSHLGQHKTREDYGLLQELCFGSCRWFHLLDAQAQSLLKKPLRQKDADVRCLIVIGLYQLYALRIPQHAALNETVAATAVLKKAWAKGLVNALLRSWLRSDSGDRQSHALAHSHPDWLLAQLKAQYPDNLDTLVDANNTRPPMTLRVNLSKTSRQEVLEKLNQQAIAASPAPFAAMAIYLEKPVAVASLPGFSDGHISIQDEASQFVPGLLQLSPGQRVLDACSAPGGKSCHILETEPALAELVALDIEPRRLQRVTENLNRLDLAATLVTADARYKDSWWDGVLFDRILLDAPCSATGVIRRHPDVKLLRRPEEIDLFQKQQLQMLEALWSCLKPGGILLYTTCSVLTQENSQLVELFLNKCDTAKSKAITANWGVECRHGRQLLPANNSHDGFFYSQLLKLPV